MREFLDWLKEGKKILEEGFNDIDEMVKDGFKEMVINGNSDYKTSYDKKDEARQLINEQRNKLEDKCETVNNAIQKLNKIVEDANKKKIKLAEAYNKYVTLHETVSDKVVPKVSIPTYNFQQKSPTLSDVILMPTTVKTVNLYTRLGIVSNSSIVAGPAALDDYASRKARVQAANEYLEAAHDFKNEVTLKLTELEKMGSVVEKAEKVLKEENTIVETLLKTSINKSTVNEYGQQLRILMTEFVLDENGNLNEEYRSAVKSLKNYIKAV